MDKKQQLQNHLSLIRSCAGWTAEALGKKLGVSRSMISNIEQGRELTQMQYLAIRKVLDDEIARSENDTKMLYFVIDALVDHPDNYTVEERSEILSKTQLLAPSIIKRPEERKSIYTAWKAVLAASGVIASAALIAFIKNKDK